MTDNAQLELLVRKLDNHVKLSDEDKQLIRDLPYVERELAPGSYIVREGEEAKSCGVLLKGFAFRQKLSVDGARQILSVHIPGEALDLAHLFLDCADHSVQALSEVLLAIVPRNVLRQLAMERPAIAHAFAVSNQVDASIFREWLLNVGRRDSKTRLAHLLCEISSRLQQQGLVQDNSYELPMSQEQLADATGMTSVHINRMLMALEREGLIERDKKTIRLPEPERIKRLAGFNSLYLHLGRQAAAMTV